MLKLIRHILNPVALLVFTATLGIGSVGVLMLPPLVPKALGYKKRGIIYANVTPNFRIATSGFV